MKISLVAVFAAVMIVALCDTSPVGGGVILPARAQSPTKGQIDRAWADAWRKAFE